jgi:DNA-binding NtrC family response regulator
MTYPTEAPRVLVVDDEEPIRRSLVTVLKRNAFMAAAAATAEEALERFRDEAFDIVVTDIRLPGISGVDLMEKIKTQRAETIVVLITAQASLDSAIAALRLGAGDYFTKPIRFEGLILRLRNLLRLRDLEWENRVLRIERRVEPFLADMIGESPPMVELRKSISQIAVAPGNVLIEGESGTGKELVARAIHAASPDRSGAFVAVNCSSIPEALFESELFGHKRGAFTGAERDREGLFRQATRGTLFLDEIAELPLSLQPKALRAIESRAVRPLGGALEIPVDVRIVAATNRDLEACLKEGSFREDLFFRLCVLRLAVPPLRERPGDIPLLARHFLERFRKELRSPAREFSADALALLSRLPFRGNVRELQNVIQRIAITALSARIDAAELAEMLRVPTGEDRTLKSVMRAFEIEHVRRVVKECEDDKRKAAERLGISLASLYTKLGN